VAGCAVSVPAEVAAAVRALGVPAACAVLAVHGRVLAALTGERDVVAGWVPGPGVAPQAVPLTTRGTSWRALVRDAAEAAPVAGGGWDTVVDPAGDGPLPDGAALRVGIEDDGDRLALRLRYRTDALDDAAAARIAGYHVTALALLAADPDGAHEECSLLSAAELAAQLDGLAGPSRPLPDRRVHELVADQASARPDEVAIVHGDRRWTYRDLDGHAEGLARALLASGLQPEDVVAVATERTPEWAAAVLGVLRAGGAYLPVEPHFPAERIRKTLTRAGCRLVVAEDGGSPSVREALEELPGIRLLDAAAGDRSGGPAAVQVGPGSLAYLYFTSGSTGEPKGAMCEHAGFLNHVLAKIDDLGIGPGDVVAQTAPQCFDISLWQLVAPLVAGGRTVLVPQEVILDVERFVDLLAEQQVAVAQLVPSYLEVVVSYLEEHPRELPALRRVSVTGEALSRELVARWFAVRPGVALVNAYGLTETSDDTNHEVLTGVPDGDRVPLGRPLPNVRVYVVDEQLQPVPLGAPGEIVFSGICVGRGYVNDPERTARAYLGDPHHPGHRLYRSGDHGRWRPDGKLEFLGRRDAQVKIAGFRIEIGEVEAALLRAPGVRDGAVVVADRAGTGPALVAFWTGRAMDPEELRELLARSLPVYMVPAALHHRERLPLTANGKVDRKALRALAAELAVEEEFAAPRTPTERRVAAAWSGVLGVPVERIGRLDSFFDRGGTSLTAVKLAVALDRAVSLPDLMRSPVLADLAGLLDGRRPTP
jgi:amino acid adenylation domain-containing protein